ncbi:hypothetical protein OAF54_00625 [bacterium]|nr:hypothetical protein [bacterium]
MRRPYGMIRHYRVIDEDGEVFDTLMTYDHAMMSAADGIDDGILGSFTIEDELVRSTFDDDVYLASVHGPSKLWT